MNKTLLIIVGIIGLALSAPSAANAAFNFGSVSTDQLYLLAEQNSTVVTQTREGVAIVPPDWATCEYEAQQAGLSESNSYWCVQKAVIGSMFPNNCVFLCQIGVGGGISNSTWLPSMTTRIFSAVPVGHPLSYYTNANAGQQNAMDNDLLCLALPSFGIGCELKKHTPINAPPTASLSANPTSIVFGSSSALTWSSTGATSCSLDQGIGGVATSGTRAVSPTSTTMYTVTCTGTGGSTNASATITVTSMPSASLNANPSSVVSGSASTLSWSSANALLCTGTGFDTQGAATGSVSTGALSSATNYSILCTGAAGSAVPGTWQLNYSDTSDLACPVTRSNLVYTGVADCPASPQGKSCSGVGAGNVCKINTVRNLGPGSGCFIYTDVYTCSGGTGATAPPTASASATVAVTSAPLPDLTPGTVSPSSAPEDSPVTLSSNVTNGGSAAAGAFPNIFQIENVALIAANTVSSLATSASTALSASYTFTTAGTYRVRACVDNNTSWAGSVTESNENNCGEWTTVIVPACSGVGCTGYPGTLSCSVNNGSPLVGQTVTYTATPGAGATGPYVWTASDGATGLGTAATASRTFPNPGTYTMNVSSATGANASCSPQVSVGCGVATASITASPTRVKKGTTATLTIPSLSGVDGTCTVTGPGVNRTFTASGCAVPATSFPTGPINTLSTYVLSCDGGETTAKVIVNVVPAFQEF